MHPCQDPANLRANDPLAIGVEELKWTFPSLRPIPVPFHNVKTEKETKNIK